MILNLVPASAFMAMPYCATGVGTCCAQRQFTRLRLLPRRHARRVPGHHRVVVLDRIADVDELRRIELDRLVAHRLLQRQRLIGGGDGEAVLRRDIVDVARSDPAAAARHLLGDDGRLARNVVRHVAGDEPRIDIVGAAGREADHHLDGPALVELLNRLRPGSRREQD